MANRYLTRTSRRLLLVLGIALTLVAGPLCFGTPAASAHATLERSEPAANAELAAEPRRVELFFDQPVSLALGAATVVGPSGAPVGVGQRSSAGGSVLTIALRPGAGEGSYAVSYRVISADSHPVAGGFFFRVGQAAQSRGGAGAVPPASGTPAGSVPSGTASEDATVAAVAAACRYAGFLGLLLLVGGVVFLIVLGPDASGRVRREAWLGLALAAAGSMGELVLQAPYAAGTPLSAITGTAFDEVVNSTFGQAHLLRLAALAVTAPVLAGLSTGARRPRWATASAPPLGVALALTWAYSGHAGTTTPALSVPSDVLHLLAVTAWVGGLVVLASAVLPVAGPGELRVALRRWSALAMACVAALIVSGTTQTLLELAGWRQIFDTTYGRLLVAKIALLAVVLAIASYSRRWVQRWCAPGTHQPAAGDTVAVDPSRAEVGRLRRAVAAESLLALAALAVAAVLIEAAPGTSAEIPLPAAARARPTTGRHGAYVAAVRRGDVVIHLKVDPAVVGVQYIYLGATRPGGGRIPVRQWTLTVSNTALGLDRVDVPVVVDASYVYGSFTMPTAGIWTVEVTARTSDVDETIVSRRVAVRS